MIIDIISNNVGGIRHRFKPHTNLYFYTDVKNTLHCGKSSILLSVEYGKRIPDEVIREYEKHGGAVYNIHRADPELYAGASVLNHQILDGQSVIDVSLIRVRPGEPLDGGEVINMWPINIHNMLYSEVVEECRKRYEHVIWAIKRENHERNRVYRRKPKDSKLTLSPEQRRIIMAADNERFPAFFYLGDRKIILKAYRR